MYGLQPTQFCDDPRQINLIKATVYVQIMVMRLKGKSCSFVCLDKFQVGRAQNLLAIKIVTITNNNLIDGKLIIITMDVINIRLKQLKESYIRILMRKLLYDNYRRIKLQRCIGTFLSSFFPNYIICSSLLSLQAAS